MDAPPLPVVERQLHRLRQALEPAQAAMLDSAEVAGRLHALALASDFAIETLCRQPSLLARLLQDALTPLAAPVLEPGQAAQWPTLLRRFRRAESTRLVWRDVVDGAPVEDILAGATALAQTCLQQALAALEDEFAGRHGVVRAGDGTPVRLVVFGLGKLGGGELNFSSDIDLVYAYAQDGDADGARPLAAEPYFARLGQRLAQLLDESTAEGFCHRVDLRLRPFGSAGRVALPFSAMDVYFQREGRDWERYAWLKARAVAGDIAAGEAWLRTLRPFVYRRYLDFTALDGLRAMKAMIAAEVEKRELADDIKRGPGGIREIEFLAQALQLVHGGRDARLRTRSLLAALAALAEAGLLPRREAAQLADAYRWLRVLENRVQMLRDAQTHALPADAQDRLRIAQGLGHPDVAALQAELARWRGVVAAAFAPLMATPQPAADADHLAAFRAALAPDADPQGLAVAGFADAPAAQQRLREFLAGAGVRALSDPARVRLQRVLPALLQAAARSAHPDVALQRSIALLQAILRRASYLALLDEQPAALARLVDTVARSGWLAERVVQYPLLLDELLDARAAGPAPTRADMHRECAAAVQGADIEVALRTLNETRLALVFRLALARLDARISAEDCAARLAWLAGEVVAAALGLAQAEVAGAYGPLPDARFAVLGYGSVGGEEMGFGSDLDLVFVFQAPPGAESTGARPLEAGRWEARLAQKLVALLATVTSAGRLYDTDLRLRPDGGKGLPVSSLAAFADYQRQRAWTWEHQALARARGLAGDPALLERLDHLRAEVLAAPRDAPSLREDVLAMRARMRTELDRSQGEQFDLKQGAGGLVDLEFLLQYLVLREGARHGSVLVPRNSAALLQALAQAGVLAPAEAAALHAAHACLLQAGLACTLDRRPRVAVLTPALRQARATVVAACVAQGLDFAAPPPPLGPRRAGAGAGSGSGSGSG